MLHRIVATLVVSTVLVMPAFADDWTAIKLRGTAEALFEEAWVPLKRGDVISDDRPIRTLANSRLELQHGDDIVTLDADTQVSIEDIVEDAQTKTVVHQSFGVVEVEAEVKETNHLTVETKFLAAVVKGTHFIVFADETGASVEVTRGLVAVEAAETKQSTSVAAGNTAFVQVEGPLWVTGSAPPPKLFDATGIEIPMPKMPSTAGVRRPALGASSNSSNSSGPALQVAEATPSAGLGVALQLPLGGDSAQSAAPKPATGGLDIATTGIGIAIGIMLGSVALLLRRIFR